jgi:transposase
MERVHERCCGLDVHKERVVACVRTPGPRRSRGQVRTFGTTTSELLRLCDWLTENEVTHVAMESTGVYWKPVFNVLEGTCEVLLVNAQHIKAVPGRKTDVRDCEWIAELLEHGLLKASFIPPEPIRDLRDLTRYRKTLIRERASEVNRIQKLLESANIKLASVATDVVGASGRAMLKALISGQHDPEYLADLAKGTLRAKRGHLVEALSGRFRDHHAFMIRQMLAHIEELEQRVAQCSARVEECMAPLALERSLLETIPGVGRLTAEVLIAEMGVDMTRFASSAHFASWAGLCPGNNESAGKRRSARVRKGNVWLKTALVEAALAAKKQPKTYFSALGRRLGSRRGAKRATIAVAHAIGVAAWHILAGAQPYRDLGPNHFDNLASDRLRRHYVRRLRDLGFNVALEPAA